MDRSLRSILWVLIALVVLSSFSATWFFLAKEKLYAEYANLEMLFRTSMERLDREMASLNQERDALRTKLESVKKELNVLEARNRDLEEQYEDILKERGYLSKELVSVKKGKFFLEKKLKKVQSEDFLASLLKDKLSMEMELKRVRDMLVPRDMEIERLRQANGDIETELSNLVKEKEEAEQNLKNSNDVIEILSRDFLREKGRNEEHKKKFGELKVENRLLKTRISEAEDIKDKYNKMLADREGMRLNIAELKKEIDRKAQELDSFRSALREDAAKDQEIRAEAYHTVEEVDLPPIILERQGYREPAHGVAAKSLERINEYPGFSGKIVSINREYNFAVINLGKEDGIDVGTRFNVYRGKVMIGTMETIQTRNTISACDIKDVKANFNIEIDDVIVKR